MDTVSEQSTTASATGSKRRGRRPGGSDTKGALIDAAREVFAESGYDGATVRGIAQRAGVDAAMVNHWFGSKEGLFAEAVLRLPFSPKDLVAQLLNGDQDTLGERIVRTFVTTWDEAGGGTFAAIVRSVTSHEQAIHLLRDFFIRYIFSEVLRSTGSDQQLFRATLAASQMIGLGMVRYVVQFDPLASADIDTVVTAIAPTLQRYLTGEID
ncbi:TetR/AcrR family transcriptional regulator [Haloechinothrix halophila]|uniref:TetR/AcrR family transcriptional regulator n=1 Tax=Haloechinothrix halophila TaxID=1069073 RepID=UPI001E2A9D51|nr:TetR family transcriptional regulator [Haloechinothrix halophila]